jgi:hypothetical protein
VITVGVETAGVGNLDDVVRWRRDPPHSYSQVKYAVDARILVGSEYLLKQSSSGGPSILSKIASAWRKLTKDGAPVQLALITNRSIDTNDPLTSRCDSRTLTLMPRAAEESPKALREARQEWAEEAGLTEAELLSLLEVLCFETGLSVPSVRKMVAAQMSAIGLPSQDKDLDAAADWVARQVRDGHTELDADAIDQAVADLWPEASFAVTQTPATIGSRPRGSELRSEEEVRERLLQLPAMLGERLLETWREEPRDTWQLIASLTRTQPPPAEVLVEWADRQPAWLLAAAWPVRVAVGELAGAYGQARLAADLFREAVADGAVRGDFRLARAALIYDELGDGPARMTTLAGLGPGPSREPYARGVVALLSGDPPGRDTRAEPMGS